MLVGEYAEGKEMKKAFTSLRITGGELKNKEIKSPEDKKTHPMGSRERLALMNIIGPDIKNAVILDAFSGTGAIGFEALSRGANHVTFIEKNHQIAAVLKENVKNLGIEKTTQVFEKNVEDLDFKSEFDYVIADPPYDKINKIKSETFDKLVRLSKKAFILSHPSNFDPHSVNAELKSTKSYAGARISIFTKS